MSNSKPNAGYGILSYLGILIIVPILDEGFRKTKYGKLHLNQAIILYAIGFGAGFVSRVFFAIPYVGWVLQIPLAILSVGLFVLWIMGIISAAQGEMKKLPLIGDIELIK